MYSSLQFKYNEWHIEVRLILKNFTRSHTYHVR